MRADPRFWDFTAAGLAMGLAVFELVRLIAGGGASAGYTTASSVVLGSLFIGVLVLTAVGLVLHRPMGWIAGIGAFLAAAGHGIALRAGGTRVGSLYLVASLALLALLVKDLRWYQSPRVVLR